MAEPPLLLDSITDADVNSQGRVAVSGSHGGIYAAAVGSKWGLRATLFNDAGIGLQQAGVGGVLALSDVGMAAAALDCQSCRIGSAEDAMDRGVISVVNAAAASLGVSVGMTAAETTALFDHAPQPHGQLPSVPETRTEMSMAGSGTRIWLLDSASLVQPGDEGEIVITGSHGGLVGGNPARALKAAARIAVFNDAGVGVDGVGITRLPALDLRGVAALTVDRMTARIGDARSALETGVISYANAAASNLGARPGIALQAWLQEI